MIYEHRCITCGLDFHTNSASRKYCSRKCYQRKRFIAAQQDKICPNCKKVFRVAGGHGNRKYCSFDCSVKHRSRPNWHKYDSRKCPNCSRQFQVIHWSKNKFCSPKCGSGFRRGKPNGRKLPYKYKKQCKSRTTTIDGRQVFIHRLCMEKAIGRRITSIERVHHINCDMSDDRIENLYLFPNEREHQYAHRGIEKLIKGLLVMNVIAFEKGRYMISA